MQSKLFLVKKIKVEKLDFENNVAKNIIKSLTAYDLIYLSNFINNSLTSS